LQLVALNAGGQAVLLESIVSNLLSCLNDPSSLIRQLCLKGLSSVSHLEEEQVSFMVFDGFTYFVRKEGFWYSADIVFCLFIKVNVLSEKALVAYTEEVCVSEV
jgi:hypothetical protein